jgi:DNA (cytosine-5)-methyltransferase 1
MSGKPVQPQYKMKPNKSSVAPTPVPMLFADLYTGCGGMSLGLMKAGWRGFFAIEKHPFAFDTFQHNLMDLNSPWHFDWPSWLPQNAIDIRKFTREYMSHLKALRGKVALIAGGPPCQGYSTAGRRNRKDSRNALVDVYLEIVEIIQPSLVLLENVYGITIPFKDDEAASKTEPRAEILSSAEKIRKSLSKRYFTFDAIIMAKDYGVPQTRPRYIMIAVNKSLSDENNKVPDPFLTLEQNRKCFLQSLNLPVKRNITVGEGISDLLKAHGTVQSTEYPCFQEGLYGPRKGAYQKLLRITRDGKRILAGKMPDSHRFVNHKQATITKFKQIMRLASGRHLSPDERKKLGIKKHTIAVLAESKTGYTLTTLPDDRIHYLEPRILTIREYARLQSFPDWFVFKGDYTTGGKTRKKNVPRYTQVGNAVPPLMAEGLGSGLMKYYRALVNR